MVFTRRLREPIRRGEITCTVRFWISPRVTVGKRYPMEEGAIEVDSIEPIGFPNITPELARESGFLGVLDLLKVAKHGRGQNIYLTRFNYVCPRQSRGKSAKASVKSPAPRDCSAVFEFTDC
jgi:hypothetical protein